MVVEDVSVAAFVRCAAKPTSSAEPMVIGLVKQWQQLQPWLRANVLYGLRDALNEELTRLARIHVNEARDG